MHYVIYYFEVKSTLPPHGGSAASKQQLNHERVKYENL